jgi:hypothetical protein
MNDPEMTAWENELKRLKPAEPPASLLARLESLPQAASRDARQAQETTAPRVGSLSLAAAVWRWVLWGTPAAAAVVAGLVAIGRFQHPSVPAAPDLVSATNGGPEVPTGVAQGSGEDALEIDRHFLASYEAVAELPEGGPVLFRCNQWEDRVIFRDPERGISIERRTPRLEVVPVRFESY